MAKKIYTEEEARKRRNKRQSEYSKKTNYAAQDKFNKESTKSISIRFMKKNESELIDWLNMQPNKAGYIKELIYNDMMKRRK